MPQNVSNKNSNPHKSELIGPTNPKDGRTSPLEIETKKKQGNRGDMRKIHLTRLFFEAGGPQRHFFEKTKKPFLDVT